MLDGRRKSVSIGFLSFSGQMVNSTSASRWHTTRWVASSQ
ncbi:hypothetical protein GQ600_24016 [Phytophthora cactorum]|nr:hypothetical protein GQ600_24016 [Phytophthora cactorum]